jgi:tetratricopeptide (TPR) repeat protein
MSPEQIERRHIDGRSDLFALGATLYECLTGRPAFDAPDPYGSFAKVLHSEPPPPSTVRSGLDARHDAVCARLLAKDPANRFRSADEVIGALHMLGADKVLRAERVLRGIHRWLDRGRWRRQLVAATAVTGVVVLLGLWWKPPPPPPPEAQRWYRQGTESLREGAYYSAAIALEESLRIHRAYPMAYARLAEARMEIDDERAAQEALVRIPAFVRDESALPRHEQLRLAAIRLFVLRDLDAATRSYRELAEMQKTDAGAWLDLGRAQEAAGLLSDARDSYERALRLDSQNAAAYLQLGVIEAAEGNSDESMKRLAEAERLYRASANTEGETEVLIRRGLVLDGIGELQRARTALEQAAVSAAAIRNPFQAVRVEMILSSVTASEGQFEKAESIASTAVQAALEGGFETAAAEGLIDLAATLAFAEKYREAEAQLQKASELAQRRSAARVLARARTQRAALHIDEQQPAMALTVLKPALQFFSQHHYRRYELTALTIASRAYQQLDDIEQAHKLARQVVDVAEVMKNDGQVAIGVGNLAAQATTLGLLPQALEHRERAETIHRRQRDLASLPYDLTNRAEILIRLGKVAEGRQALEEVDAGVQKGLAGYAGRRRRVLYLRALERVIAGDFAQAAMHARAIAPEPGSVDSATVFAPILLDYAEIRLRRSRVRNWRSPGIAASLPPAFVRESQYWRAASMLARDDARGALAAANQGLQQLAQVRNNELEWRLAAVASIAAGRLGDTTQQATFHDRAVDVLARLRADWGQHGREYETRPDLRELRTAARL